MTRDEIIELAKHIQGNDSPFVNKDTRLLISHLATLIIELAVMMPTEGPKMYGPLPKVAPDREKARAIIGDIADDLNLGRINADGELETDDG